MIEEHKNIEFQGVRFNILNDDMKNIEIEVLNKPYWSIRRTKEFVKTLDTVSRKYRFGVSYVSGTGRSDEYFTHSMAYNSNKIDEMFSQGMKDGYKPMDFTEL